MLEELRLLLKAKTGLIYLVSYEEERVEDTFEKICKQLSYGLYIWDLNRGFREVLQDKYKSAKPKEDAILPDEALEAIQKYNSDAVFIMKDFQRFLDVDKFGEAPKNL